MSRGNETDSSDLKLVLGQIANDLTEMKNQITSLREAVNALENK
jgi:hypothetical protein